MDELELLDWKRRVFALYANVRASRSAEAAWHEWREARDTLFRGHPQSPLAHNCLGLSLAKAGRHGEAIPHYTRAIALQPTLIDAYLNLAISHANRGETGDAIAVTLEADGTGAIYPVVYTRRGGRLNEVVLDPDPLLRYDTPAVQARLAELVKPA